MAQNVMGKDAANRQAALVGSSTSVGQPIPSSQGPSTPSSGTDYGAVQNPYANQYLRQTGWDRFVNWLGFNSGYDKAEALRKSNSDLWESQHSEQQREEMYNSAEEVVARERAAGLNPNLSGDVVGEGASPDAAPEGEPVPAVEMANQVYDFGEFVQTAVSMSLQMASGFSDVQGSLLRNAGMDIENISNFLPISGNFIKSYISTNGSKFDPDDPDSKLTDALKDHLFESVDYLPRSYRRKYRQYLERFIGGNEFKAIVADSLNEAAPKIAASSGSGDVVKGFSFDSMSQGLAPVTDLAKGMSEASSKAAEYLYRFIPQQKPMTELSEEEAAEQRAQNEKAMKHINEMLNSSLEESINNLSRTAENGSPADRTMASFLLLAISALRFYKGFGN